MACRGIVRVGKAEIRGGEGVGCVFKDGNRVVGARGSVVHSGDVDRHRVGRCVEVDTAVGRAAVILHLEGEARVPRAVGIGDGREGQQAAVDVRHADTLARGHRNAVQAQRAGGGQRRDRHGGQRVGGRIVRIGKAEVRRGEGVNRVFQQRDGGIRARGRVVHRSHVDGHRVGGLVEVDAAQRRAAVILNLEGESGITRASTVGHGREGQQATVDIGDRNALACRDGNAVQAQRAGARQRRDGDRRQGIRRGVVRVGKAEVRGGEGIGCIFQQCDGGIRARGRIVHGRHVDRHRIRNGVKVDTTVRRAATVLHLEGKAGVSRAVRICDGRKGQQAAVDVGDRNALPCRHCDAVQAQRAGGGERGDSHGRQRMACGRVVRIGKAEVRGGEHIGRIFQRRHGGIRAVGRVVHGGDVDRHRVGGGVEVDTAVRRAAVVLHLEGKAGIARAVRIRNRGESQLPAVDIGDRNALPCRHRNAAQAQGARGREAGDCHGGQRIGGRVVGVGKAEVRSGEGIGRVLEDGDCVVRAGRRVVDRGHVDRHRVGRLVNVHAAVRSAAVVLHLEGKGGVTRTIAIRPRGEGQEAAINIGDRNALAGGHRNAVQAQGARRRECRDSDGRQRVGGAVVRIGKAEVGSGKGISGVFEQRNCIIRARGRVGHSRNVECEAVG